MPTGFYVSYARSAIDIDHCGIFPGRVEVVRFHHTVIKIGVSVGCLYRSRCELRHGISLPRVVRNEVAHSFCRLRIYYINVARNVRLGVIIYYQTAFRRQSEPVTVTAVGMTTLAVIKQSALSGRHIDRIDVVLNGTALRRKDYGRLVLHVKSHQCKHHPLAACKLFRLAALRTQQVKMVVSVALALKNELAAVPWQESDRIDRVYVFVMMLMI